MTQRERGETGRTGDMGRTGDTGWTGDTGDTGEVGATGEAGTPGVEGRSGPAGAPGSPGAAGAQGRRGITGEPGVSRHAALIGYGILLVFVVFGFWRTEEVRNSADEAIAEQAARVDEATIQASIDACQRQNDVRNAVAAVIGQQIQNLRQTPPSLFPDIPTAKFEQLVEKGVEQQQDLLVAVKPVRCHLKFPPPVK